MDPEEIAQYVSNSNEVTNLNLKRPVATSKPKSVFSEPFHPEFTYPIFGENEAIFGYTDLEIDLDFRSNDLQPSLTITSSGKWDSVGELQAVDVEGEIAEFLPKYVTDKSTDPPSDLPDATSAEWKPPGKLLHSYTYQGRTFEIWSASLADRRAREIFRNMQIFVTFYIEGGTQQDLDDQDWTLERWTLFLLYETTPLKPDLGCSPYTIVGFATSYRLWVFPTFEIMRATKSLPSPPSSSNGEAETYTPSPLALDPETHMYAEKFDPLAAPSRERISQFVVLPPFQRQGHGAALYNAMFKLFVGTPNIFEITVEDPNEAFDDMRDICDISYLRTLPEFQALALPSALPRETLAKDANIPRELILGTDESLKQLRHKSKISPRQFHRMIELHLLSTIPPLHRSTARITRKDKSAHENDRKYYFWRLALKDRLYRHNADQLAQVERDERIESVEATARNVESDYERLLGIVEKRGQWRDNGDASNGRSKRRRMVVDEDESEETDGAGSEASKKRRVK